MFSWWPFIPIFEDSIDSKKRKTKLKYNFFKSYKAPKHPK
jgi:hypothetical protein